MLKHAPNFTLTPTLTTTPLPLTARFMQGNPSHARHRTLRSSSRTSGSSLRHAHLGHSNDQKLAGDRKECIKKENLLIGLTSNM